MRVLHLHLKGEYFDEIKANRKPLEYREENSHWAKRLERQTYDMIEICRGYPKKGDASRRIYRPWRGFFKTELIHPHFGPDPVSVYAIHVSQLEGKDLSIASQIKEALNNSVANEYQHEYDRPPIDIALEIHDWSGIEGFDPDDARHKSVAKCAVQEWRLENPKPIKAS